MFNSLANAWFNFIGGVPCFRIYGKGRREKNWRVIHVFAAARRNSDSRWPRPFWPGTLITWTDSVISLGWDAAETVLREQASRPSSRETPLAVPGGRVRARLRPKDAPLHFASMSEVIAHECGHTWQARRLSWLYLPTGAIFTLFREGTHWWNRFENQASEEGLFGGIVNGSVHPKLTPLLKANGARTPF